MDRNEVIAKLKAAEPRLRAHGVAALYLFGSYARDEARKDSDVDVLVDPATQDFHSLSHFVGAYEILRDAVPGRKIGYGTRNGLSKYIRPDVEQEAIRNLLMAAAKSPLMRLGHIRDEITNLLPLFTGVDYSTFEIMALGDDDAPSIMAPALQDFYNLLARFPGHSIN
jgi:hypothetical protein